MSPETAGTRLAEFEARAAEWMAQHRESATTHAAPPAETPEQAQDRIDLADAVRRLRIATEARAVERARQAGAQPFTVDTVAFVGLDEMLTRPRSPVAYRITGLMRVGARVVLAAQFKAGKSTLIGNLLRVLADGGQFLDRFDVADPGGNLGLVDNELSEDQLCDWLRDQSIDRSDRVKVVSLRGKVSTFDLLDNDIRKKWAEKLRALEIKFLVLDCLRPVLDSLGLSEDKDAGRFLVAFDALIAEAGISEAVVVHHMGHNGERARGDSRLRDWPDAEWRIVRQSEAGDEPDPAAPRFLSAFGRDVNVPEGALTFDAETRHLTFAGGSRKEAKASVALPAVLEALATADAPISGQAIEEALAGSVHGRAAVRSAIKAGRESGVVLVEKGAHGAHLHFLNPSHLASSPDLAAASRQGSSPLASDVRAGEVARWPDGLFPAGARSASNDA